MKNLGQNPQNKNAQTHTLGVTVGNHQFIRSTGLNDFYTALKGLVPE